VRALIAPRVPIVSGEAQGPTGRVTLRVEVTVEPAGPQPADADGVDHVEPSAALIALPDEQPVRPGSHHERSPAGAKLTLAPGMAQRKAVAGHSPVLIKLGLPGRRDLDLGVAAAELRTARKRREVSTGSCGRAR